MVVGAWFKDIKSSYIKSTGYKSYYFKYLYDLYLTLHAIVFLSMGKQLCYIILTRGKVIDSYSAFLFFFFFFMGDYFTLGHF